MHGGDSGAAAAAVLVGNVGQEFVQNTLTTMDPLSAIQVRVGCCGCSLLGFQKYWLPSRKY
jgi:hypothetical protein